MGTICWPLNSTGVVEHADVLKALHMRQIALTECHEEANALDLRQVAGQRLDLLVVQQIHVLPADLREIILAVDGHGGISIQWPSSQ